jgi:hypothetical protein
MLEAEQAPTEHTNGKFHNMMQVLQQSGNYLDRHLPVHVATPRHGGWELQASKPDTTSTAQSIKGATLSQRELLLIFQKKTSPTLQLEANAGASRGRLGGRFPARLFFSTPRLDWTVGIQP